MISTDPISMNGLRVFFLSQFFVFDQIKGEMLITFRHVYNVDVIMKISSVRCILPRKRGKEHLLNPSFIRPNTYRFNWLLTKLTDCYKWSKEKWSKKWFPSNYYWCNRFCFFFFSLSSLYEENSVQKWMMKNKFLEWKRSCAEGNNSVSA